ncbi:hypothetical protein [Pseudonocardia sp. ICBG601]|uniref:hypothetical protein n=1 Tax=Pseudonocardia sp. ICBG601 TaxID=2846759 RepID=UPI001CF71AA4|nr:hypothetical protein [Pseudonocardia sp. ICBG601]
MCPKNATATWTTTTATSHATVPPPVIADSANAALTLFTANQPKPEVIVIRAAGSALPR